MVELKIKAGDRLQCYHPLTKGEVEITEYPRIDANETENWNWCVINGNQLMHIDYFSNPNAINEKTAWNPDDFGSLAYKADGDQLTIFHEDTNEPPEPDNYSNTVDYEQAWTEWESKNNRIKNKDMPFQFSATSVIAEQIAHLQEQLNQLTASLKPYQECEQKAEDLRLEVLTHAANMREKGIQQDEVFRWAKSLYSAASGMEFNEDSSSVVAAQNEVIAQLKSELATAQKRASQASIDRMEATALLENTTAQRDELKLMLENLSSQMDAASIELLQKENASLIVKIKELEELTDDMDAQLSEQQLLPQVESLKQENEEVKNFNKELRSRCEQLEQKLDFFKQDTREFDSYVQQIKVLEKESTNYQQMYEGQKEQKEYLERDFYAVRKQRDEFYSELQELKRPADSVMQDRLNATTEIQQVESKEELVNPEGDEHKVIVSELDLLVGDIVQHNDGIVGTISYIPDPFKGIVTVLMPGGVQNFHAENLKLVSRPSKKSFTDTIKPPTPQEFLDTLKSKAKVQVVTWEKIKTISSSDPNYLREIALLAKTKHQKDLIKKVPELLVEYISRTGDRSDLDWVSFKDAVEALLEPDCDPQPV